MIAFNAHKVWGQPQTGFVPNVYNVISWPVIDYNEGGRFDGRWFVPVRAGEPDSIIVFSGQIWLQAGAPMPGNYVCKLFKNAGGIRTAIFANGAFANSGPMVLSCQDKATAGDQYDLQLYTTEAGAVVDGDPAHTFWSGASI